MNLRLGAILLYFVLAAMIPAATALPILDDQYGQPGGLDEFAGQAVLVIVTTPRKLRWIGRWEAALRKEIPRLNSVRIADIDEEPPPDPDRVAEVLRQRVPPGVSILIDLDGQWAEHYRLDTNEPCLVLLDSAHQEVARFRGRPKGALVDEVLTALRDYFPPAGRHVTDADLILVGGGLANTLIALRLADAQPDLRVLLIERDDRLGGNHTWSFHGSDLDDEQRIWIEPLIQYSWNGYEVQFPDFSRRLGGTYHSLTSERLHDIARGRLADRVRTGTPVGQLAADRVTLEDGTVLTAGAVIDGRGPGPDPALDVRYQKFVGLVLELKTPHHMDAPVIMDAGQSQQDGYRFFYLLPFDERTMLIEDTRYSDTPDIASHDYAREIREYAAARGWQIESVLREEQGVLPITLDGDIDAFWASGPRIARSGLRAALFHAGTGYSLPCAVDLADQLARNHDWTAEHVYALTRAASESLWERGRFYRVLNRLLFIAADPDQRRRVLQRFYGLNEGLIRRFYAGKNTFPDKFRILCGKPPVQISRALDAIFRYESSAAAGKHPHESH